MTDLEWAAQELEKYQKEEVAAMARVSNAQGLLKAAKAELAEAKEALSGIRGGIAEFAWQLKYCKEHGRLP